MPVRCHHTEVIETDPSTVFRMIDDLPATAKWLPPCVSLDNLSHPSPEKNAVGDRLRYVYRQGRRTGEMDGQIVARVEGRQIHCLYADKMFEVSVDLQVAPGSVAGTTDSTHIIQITPKSFFGRLMSPLVRIGVGKQTRTASANLKKLLESKVS